MRRHFYLLAMYSFLFIFGTVNAQEYKQQMELAAKYHNEYKFDKAIEIYRSILSKNKADSSLSATVNAKLVNSENGKKLLQFASSPVLATKQVFPLESFYLYYPGFEDGSWITPPQEYMKGAEGNPFNIMNFPAESDKMVFSVPGENGSWDIMFSTKLNDSLWTTPQIVNENITTSGDEIMPYLSPCGKILYFSSNGHSGMGGFDLYMSKWDEESGDWGIAQNMGFPFSSTKNDYLYFNTPDGNFTLFSSDRETSENEVTIYITQFENLPLKNEISQEKAYLCSTLEYQPDIPVNDGMMLADKNEDESEHPEYTSALKEVRDLQDKLKNAIASLDQQREKFSNTADSLQRLSLEEQIKIQEAEILELNQNTSVAVNKLQDMELDFLSKGIIIAHNVENMDKYSTNARFVAHAAKFEFAKNKKGVSSGFQFEVEEPEVDLSLKIGDEAVIADLADLPDGLVYHIQLMTTLKKAPLKSLKGFSPVFERRVQSGKYTYSVGVFQTYAEALKNLNNVRKRGFPTAMITAYNNGKSITTKSARVMEKQDNSIYRVVIGGYETLPAEAISVIRSKTNRDIAKVNVGGTMKYVVGPFSSKDQAETLSSALNARKVSGVEVEKVENK